MEKDDIINNSSFQMLEGKIDSRIIQAVHSMGIWKPTKIQAETLPHLLLQLDLIGAAKTGSGKTLAFLIPAIENMLKWKYSKISGPGCIILSPTRELALQTYNVLIKMLQFIPELKACLVVGGEKRVKDLLSLKKGPNIIVSTPGRLLDHLQSTPGFSGKNLKCLVLDEADKLLDAGFARHIKCIIQFFPKDRHTILFSATMDQRVEDLAALVMKSCPVVVKDEEEIQSTVESLEQGYCICPVEKRMAWLYKMLKKCKKFKVMVFFSSCKSVDFHHEFFRLICKANVSSIHGQLSQARRKDAYHNFLAASSGALFCTDVAARGLDIPNVDWIVQYDPPTDPKEYIHRVGRTARGQNKVGNAVLLLRPEEESLVDYLKKENVYMDKYSFEDPSDNSVQEMLENLLQKNGVMKILARKAYLAFLRCYKTHPLKKIFNVKNLDLAAAAKAFGFREPPDVDFQYNFETTGQMSHIMKTEE